MGHLQLNLKHPAEPWELSTGVHKQILRYSSIDLMLFQIKSQTEPRRKYTWAQKKLLGKGYGPDSSEFFSLQEFMIWGPTWSSHRAVFWEQPELLTEAQSQKAGQSSFECIIGSAQSTLSLWLGILMLCVNCSTIHNTKGIHHINDHPEVISQLNNF